MSSAENLLKEKFCSWKRSCGEVYELSFWPLKLCYYEFTFGCLCLQLMN